MQGTGAVAPPSCVLAATGTGDTREGRRAHSTLCRHERRLPAGCGAAGGWVGAEGGAVGPEALEGQVLQRLQERRGGAWLGSVQAEPVAS